MADADNPRMQLSRLRIPLVSSGVCSVQNAETVIEINTATVYLVSLLCCVPGRDWSGDGVAKDIIGFLDPRSLGVGIKVHRVKLGLGGHDHQRSAACGCIRWWTRIRSYFQYHVRISVDVLALRKPVCLQIEIIRDCRSYAYFG